MAVAKQNREPLVFPLEVREVVRERFPECVAGKYDEQYESDSSVCITYILSSKQCIINIPCEGTYIKRHRF